MGDLIRPVVKLTVAGHLKCLLSLLAANAAGLVGTGSEMGLRQHDSPPSRRQ